MKTIKICFLTGCLLCILGFGFIPVLRVSASSVNDEEDNTVYTEENWMDAYNYMMRCGTSSLSTVSGADSNAYAFVKQQGIMGFDAYIASDACKGITSTSDKWTKYMLFVYKRLSYKYGVSDEMSVGSSNKMFFVFNQKILNIYERKTEQTDINLALEKFDEKIGFVANIALGFGVLTCVLAFLINLGKTAIMPSHPIQRRKVMIDLVTCAICIAMLGGVRLLVFLAYFAIFA